MEAGFDSDSDASRTPAGGEEDEDEDEEDEVREKEESFVLLFFKKKYPLASSIKRHANQTEQTNQPPK